MSTIIPRTWRKCPVCGAPLYHGDPEKVDVLEELAEDFNRAALGLRGPARTARKMLHAAILVGIGMVVTLGLLAVLL